MVMMEIYTNYITDKPMKNRTEDEMIRVYQLLLKWIKETAVWSPKTNILDNEAPDEFKRAIKKQLKLQLVPPDNHQINIEERLIQTFKNNPIEILSGVDLLTKWQEED